MCNIQCSPTWCLAAPVMLAARKFWRRKVTSISTCRVTACTTNIMWMHAVP